MELERIEIHVTREEAESFNDNMYKLYYDSRPGHKECVIRYKVLKLINDIWQNYLIQKEENAMINKSNSRYSSIITDKSWIDIKTIETIKTKPYKKRIGDRTIWCTPVCGSQKVMIIRSHRSGRILREITIPSVIIFGSIAFGLDGIGSDIDIALPAGIYNASVNAHLESRRQVKLLREFQKRLILFQNESFKLGFKWKIDPILHARVPIIKLYDSKRGLSVDIGILSTQNPISSLINFYCGFEERARILYCFIKTWSKMRKVSDAMNGFPNSFGFVMFVTKYLQILRCPLIPVMDYDGNKKKLIEKHSIARFEGNTQTVLELAVSFFDYFCDFDFESYQISITSCGLQWKHSHDYNLNHADQGTVLIEDPLAKTQNVTRSIKPFNLKILKYEFFRAYKCAKNADWKLLFTEWKTNDSESIFDIYPPIDEYEMKMKKEFQKWHIYSYDHDHDIAEEEEEEEKDDKDDDTYDDDHQTEQETEEELEEESYDDDDDDDAFEDEDEDDEEDYYQNRYKKYVIKKKEKE